MIFFVIFFGIPCSTFIHSLMQFLAPWNIFEAVRHAMFMDLFLTVQICQKNCGSTIFQKIIWFALNISLLQLYFSFLYYFEYKKFWVHLCHCINCIKVCSNIVFTQVFDYFKITVISCKLVFRRTVIVRSNHLFSADPREFPFYNLLIVYYSTALNPTLSNPFNGL